CIKGSFLPDADDDGVPDDDDLCPETSPGAIVDVDGCEVFTLPSNNFEVRLISESCIGSNDGSIIINAVQNLDYTATLSGTATETKGFNSSVEFLDLSAGDYTICITVDDEASFERCYDVTITEPEALNVLSRIDPQNKEVY